MKVLKASLLLVTLVAALAIVIVPVFLLQPFAPQTPEAIAWSYRLRTVSPWLTLAFLVLGAFLVMNRWKAARWWGKLPMALAILLLAAAAFLARQNHFEWMFRPLPEARFIAASQATHVQDSDMVLAIQVGDQSRAYPVRMMAYHHVLNDVIADQAVVVTY